MSASKKTSGRGPLPWIVVFGSAAFVIFLATRNSHESPKPPSELSKIADVQKTNAPITNSNLSVPTSDEDRVVALTTEGNQFLNEGKFAEAAQRFEQAVAISGDQEDLRYNLAIALARLGKKEEAKKQYEEALRIFPEYAEAHNNLGNLLMSESKLDEAIERFREAIKYASDNASFHNNLGIALIRQSKFADALLEFEQAVKLAPSYVEGRLNLANAYLSLGRVDESIIHANEALRLKPDFAPALQTLHRARSHQSAGK